MKVYLVGGAVRDELLNRPILERDYVVIGSTPKQMKSQGYIQVGNDFPVFLHPQTKDEYALARKEKKQGQGYTGFICDFNPNITLEEDLVRRDLTINAIAKSSQGKLIDPCDGLSDLKHKTLRHIGTAFTEDPLRVLRVARFAARYHYLGFDIADETMHLMEEMVNTDQLTTLTKERIWCEIEKTLKDGAIHIFSNVLETINGLPYVLPFVKSWQPTESQKLAQQSTRLDKTAPQFSEILFCLWLMNSDVNDLNKIEQTLKIPTRFAQPLRDICLHRTTLASELCTKTTLALLNTIDIWRRPERFQLLLTIAFHAELISSEKKQHLQYAAALANDINVQEIIKRGYKGREIKIQLEKQRLDIIEEVFSNL